MKITSGKKFCQHEDISVSEGVDESSGLKIYDGSALWWENYDLFRRARFIRRFRGYACVGGWHMTHGPPDVGDS